MKKRVLAGALLCCLAAAAGAAFFLPRESAWRAAVRLQEAGDYAGAYRGFARLQGWRDSADRMHALQDRFPQLPFLEAGKWDVVTFGACEQDGDPANGPEPLEWYVLYRGEAAPEDAATPGTTDPAEEAGGNSAAAAAAPGGALPAEDAGGTDLLLLARSCLFCRAYHEPVADISWEDCTLRAYLNGAFYEEAFDEAQRRLIRETVQEDGSGGGSLPGAHVHEEAAGMPSGSGGSPADPVTDRVFLLDGREMAVYFPREEDRWLYARAQATQEAVREGIRLPGQDGADLPGEGQDGEAFARWWLRSPGNEPYSAQFVEEDGEVYEAGAAVDIDYMYGVRPALWIRLRDGE